MNDYHAPVRDMRFVFEHVCDVRALAALPDFADLDPDSLDDLLGEAARFFAEVVAPTNRAGDTEGSRRNADGTVTTPTGFANAYARYVDAGWGASPFDPHYGGGGLPWLVTLALQEMVTAANMAFSLCPMLTQGAVHMLTAHGSDEQKAQWLPPLIAGRWAGTMNLTESQAGSDVGAISAKAVRQPDGTYRITGQKIFITWGEHDLTENIVHLTLARTPDAPLGTRGISAFIVPKFVLDEAGRPHERNAVECVSIEHKLGIHGSPTCVLAFDGAVGYLIGDENAGMRYMFTMMNNARLSVGVEGLAIADRAYQLAVAYARERVQGRASGAPAGTSSPIIEHPDVRRMLFTMRALTEAVRCICYANAEAIDLAHHGADETTRTAAQARADLLTPISKGFGTDVGIEVASLGVQVHGGMGYIEETGAAQHLRDARIASIYEGTNGIQAIDLVTRKLPLLGGGAIAALLGDVDQTVTSLHDISAYDEAAALQDARDATQTCVEWLAAAASGPDGDDVLAGATPFLRMAGLLVGGHLLGRSLVAAHRVAAEADGSSRSTEEPSFYAEKQQVARFYLRQLLPTARGLVAAVTAGVADVPRAALG
jgi:alkylation response protein AidB-like acyl-CoA dehydrogenase